MTRYVLALHEVDKTQVDVVGGKGAHLGALARLPGIDVPPGFCVTTSAFQSVVGHARPFQERLAALSLVEAGDEEGRAELSRELRLTIEGLVLTDDVAEEIHRALVQVGDQAAYAVRSSATAEDLPTASFAGQQDTFLNVRGEVVILQHLNRCWSSLFTERAVAYRLRHGFDHHKVQMAVVVQQMVHAQASGIMFTADPISGHRKVVSVEACLGLGEALVSGKVKADIYQVRDGEIIAKTLNHKHLVTEAAPEGGTRERNIDPARRQLPALTDAQVVQLAQLGRRIEAYFGCPQDIEWCLADDNFYIVQSRPITTLFPIPELSDHEKHVYLCRSSADDD